MYKSLEMNFVLDLLCA